MPVVVTNYDPRWPVVFEELRAAIWPAIADVAMAIEHVGSTSVPGLPAKPVIDMTIVVADREHLREVISRLAGIGYQHRGDLGVSGREAFAVPTDAPAHHLYACVQGCVALRNHMAVRDRLQHDPTAAAAYGRLKQQLAKQFPNDIDAYVDGKTAFILSLLQDAGLAVNELSAVEAANVLPKRTN